MKKNRLAEILKGLLTCAVASAGVFVLLVLGVILLLLAIGFLLSPLIAQMPH